MASDKTWHFCSFVAMRHPNQCPSLRIYPRSMLVVLGQIVGYDEIFFEIEGFSENFAVYTTNEPFARQICTFPLIEYMMRHLDLSVEVEPGWVAVGKEEWLVPEEIPRRIRQTEKVRGLLSF